MEEEGTKREWLRLPVVAAGAEYLVMGYLMRRNILTYQAPMRITRGRRYACVAWTPRWPPLPTKPALNRSPPRLVYHTRARCGGEQCIRGLSQSAQVGFASAAVIDTI
ncbi:MAG: hypothetical protein EOM24_20870 [Chloroflexia bacterium]|nr:hypothetical protein [Chloroflexia bacterium]